MPYFVYDTNWWMYLWGFYDVELELRLYFDIPVFVEQKLSSFYTLKLLIEPFYLKDSGTNGIEDIFDFLLLPTTELP